MGYRVKRDVQAECWTCGKRWVGPNAHGVAARHAEAHGHRTIVEVYMTIGYGPIDAGAPPTPTVLPQEDD